MIEIDGKTALELVRKQVEKAGGEFVYEVPDDGYCRYTKQGECSCIVGHALHDAGVPLKVLEAMDTASGFDTPVAIGDDDARALLAVNGVRLSNSAQLVFMAAQETQDDGWTWRTTVESAERALSGVKADE